jgi:hypothetical protein
MPEIIVDCAKIIPVWYKIGIKLSWLLKIKTYCRCWAPYSKLLFVETAQAIAFFNLGAKRKKEWKKERKKERKEGRNKVLRYEENARK